MASSSSLVCNRAVAAIRELLDVLDPGTFPNGEARLLFSSKQIEYLRYWLHAMGLTKELIPIPGGDYLIQPSDMSTCAPDVYKDAAKLKKAVKVRCGLCTSLLDVS